MDSIFIIVFLFLLGMVLIIKGGDFFVDSASWMAEVFGIPKLIVGATIVSLATTLPEMLVSFIAAAEGKADMAVGNAIGTITANVGLIMAVFILFMPTVIKRSDYLVKSILVLAAATTVFLFANDGQYEFESSIILFAIFIIFIVDNVKHALYCMKEKHKHDLEELQESKKFIHCVILTGYADFSYAQSAVRYGVSDYLLKPVNSEELHQTLKKIELAILADNELLIQSSSENTYKPEEIVALVKEYIQKHYADDITLNTISQNLGFSSSYLTKVFNKVMGTTPSKFIRDYRMNIAKQLLNEPGSSVNTVSAAIGYSDPFHFSKSFKQTFGISPTEYKNSVQ